ncbi:hypothetical protein KK083_04130 [Fulvivirgaceae bacterium PWU4]|uniref:Lipoprotein n=1 Tax=Chryseosolibacter histidini TaxID=2782349 RepID=A0AAP2GN22_9BACT|nr:hypothetical protein [Chryseosolibacter histidini]MBT1696052.1 hypothetical protein [Chryseosolibacter histidini]
MKNPLLILLIVISCGCQTKKAESINHRDQKPCFDAKRFGLEPLSGKGESTHIRIWYRHSFLNIIPMISMRRSSKQEWSAELLVVTVGLRNDSMLVEEVKRKKLTSKTNWKKLHNKLDSLKIYTLPDMDAIPGLEDGWTDGSSYHVELQHKNSCYSYRYHLPEKFQKEFWQAKHMVEILQELERAFGMPWQLEGYAAVEKFWAMVKDPSLEPERP